MESAADEDAVKIVKMTTNNLEYYMIGLPWWLRQKSVCLQCGRPEFDPWVGKIPWRRKWQPTPVLLLENPMDGGAWCRLLSMGSQIVRHDWATSLTLVDKEASVFERMDSSFERSSTVYKMLSSSMTCSKERILKRKSQSMQPTSWLSYFKKMPHPPNLQQQPPWSVRSYQHPGKAFHQQKYYDLLKTRVIASDLCFF